MRDALRAALALAPAPNGFTVAEFAAKVHAITGHDPRRLQHPPGGLRPAQTARQTARRQARTDPPLPRRGTAAARTIAALLTLRDQVIAPILAGIRSPRMGRKPAHWTRVDRDYERIRVDMQTLFSDLAIETPLAA